MYSRRDLAKLAVGGLCMPAFGAAKIDSVVEGVHLGVQTYIFSALGLPQATLVDVIVKSMAESGLGECDLFAPVVEPAQYWDRIRNTNGDPADRTKAREELAQWRNTVSLDYFQGIRKKFNDAGIEIYAMSGFPGTTEEELTRTFAIAETLGAHLVTLGVNLPAAKRIAPMVDKSKYLVGLQGRPDMSSANPDSISTAAQFEAALALSKNYWLSFDIGDATGGGYDTLQFVKDHHDRIALLYLKDRKKDRTSMPWGQGETPLAEVLKFTRDGKYSYRCYLDCDYKTTDRPADVKNSFAYVKTVLQQH